MKKWLIAVLVSVVAFTLASPASAQEKESGQIFFRGGGGFLTGDDRGGEVFTDTQGALGRLNDGDSGFSVGAGIDHVLFKDPWFGNTVLGQIVLDYAQFSNRKVARTTEALLGRTKLSRVTVNELTVAAAPKYRIELGNVRPWIIPIGLEWEVTSPASDNTSYVSVGLHFGAGIEYRILPQISIGVDVRYHFSFNDAAVRAIDFVTPGAYIGFNF